MNSLSPILEKYRSRPFIFVEPGGNHGDYLIYKGAEKLAKEIGLDFKRVSHHEFMASEFNEHTVIYLQGGGAYNPLWSGHPMQEIEKVAQTHSGPVIQGPITCYLDRNFLIDQVVAPLMEAKPSTFYFFTRERTSYDALRDVLPDWIELHSDQDTALYMEARDLATAAENTGTYTLFAIRDDKESRAPAPHPKPFRLWLDPIRWSRSFDEWVQYHAEAREVITNRLHSAIISTILGKPTTLLPNSYHKNRSVYDFSLSDRGVVWNDAVDVTLADRLLAMLPSRVTKSHKLASALDPFRGPYMRKL